MAKLFAFIAWRLFDASEWVTNNLVIGRRALVAYRNATHSTDAAVVHNALLTLERRYLDVPEDSAASQTLSRCIWQLRRQVEKQAAQLRTANRSYLEKTFPDDSFPNDTYPEQNPIVIDDEE